LWRSLSQIENVLKIISALVMVVGLIGMMIALITSLNERRREMAILRSIGAGLTHITQLVLFEVLIVLGISIMISSFFKITFEVLFSDYIQKKWGLFLTDPMFSVVDMTLLLSAIILGLLFSVIPILIFKNKSLKDGLTVK